MQIVHISGVSLVLKLNQSGQNSRKVIELITSEKCT